MPETFDLIARSRMLFFKFNHKSKRQIHTGLAVDPRQCINKSHLIIGVDRASQQPCRVLCCSPTPDGAPHNQVISSRVSTASTRPTRLFHQATGSAVFFDSQNERLQFDCVKVRQSSHILHCLAGDILTTQTYNVDCWQLRKFS